MNTHTHQKSFKCPISKANQISPQRDILSTLLLSCIKMWSMWSSNFFFASSIFLEFVCEFSVGANSSHLAEPLEIWL